MIAGPQTDRVSGKALVAAAAVVLASAGSNAQTPAPAETAAQRQGRIDGVRTLDAVARCLVKRRYEKARIMAAAPFGSHEQAKLADDLTSYGREDPCAGGRIGFLQSLSFSQDAMAGAIARALIARDYPALPQTLMVQPVDDAAEQRAVARFGKVELFGRCVVRRDTVGASALIGAQFASKAMDDAIQQLTPDLAACLPGGRKLAIDALFLRNAVSGAAYHLAQEAQPIPTKPAGMH